MLKLSQKVQNSPKKFKIAQKVKNCPKKFKITPKSSKYIAQKSTVRF